jgi:signal transduction histidine kinase
VRDNGTGVTEATRGRPCLGILGMKERAMAFGGKVTVTGAAGRGTVVRVRIPKHRHDTPDAREVRR